MYQIIIIIILLIGFISLLLAKLNWKIWMMGLFMASVVLIPNDVKILSFSVSTFFSYILSLYSIWYVVVNKKYISSFDLHVFKTLAIYLVSLLFLIILASDMPIIKQLLAHKGSLIVVQFPFFLSVILLKTRDVTYLWKIIWIVSIITGIYGIYCYIIQFNPYIVGISVLYPDSEISHYERFMSESRGGLTGRISSTVVHPVFYAGILIILFYIVLQSYISIKSKGKKLLSIVPLSILALLVVNLFLTGTRSGLVALIISLVYILYKLTDLKTKLKYIVGGFLIVTLIGGTMFFSEYQTLIESTIFFWDDSKSNGEVKGSSTSMRMVQLEGTFDLIKNESLFFGKGHGWTSDYIVKNGPHPILLGFESLLFQGLIQYGIIGFPLIYGILFLRLYKLNRKFNKRNNSSFIITNGLLISYIMYAFMTGPFFWGFFIGSYIFICKGFYIMDNNTSQN